MAPCRFRGRHPTYLAADAEVNWPLTKRVTVRAGILLQVGSVSFFGLTFTLGAPVSLAGFAAGLMLEAIATGSEAAAFYIVYQACFAQVP